MVWSNLNRRGLGAAFGRAKAPAFSAVSLVRHCQEQIERFLLGCLKPDLARRL
jgi:hypothetical protein